MNNVANLELLQGIEKIKDSYTKINTNLTNLNNDIINIPHGLYRNAIINGNFDVWQRGTSFTSSGYTADRWVIVDDGGTPSYTVTRESFIPGQTDVPGEPRYYAKIAVSATSSGAIVFAQRVEDVRTFAGQKATLSFYARADVPTTGSQVASAMFQVFGTGGSEQVGISGESIALTTSWQRYTITFNVPSIAGKIIGQGSYLYVQPLRINPSAPLTNYYIAQVQLCAGDVALPFQPRTVGEELVLCRRYCRVYGVGVPGVAVSSTGALLFVSDLHMRVAPSVRQLKTSFDIFDGGGIISTSSGTLSYGIIDAGGCTVNVGGFTGLTQYRPIVLNTPDVFILDAEL